MTVKVAKSHRAIRERELEKKNINISAALAYLVQKKMLEKEGETLGSILLKG